MYTIEIEPLNFHMFRKKTKEIHLNCQKILMDISKEFLAYNINFLNEVELRYFKIM